MTGYVRIGGVAAPVGHARDRRVILQNQQLALGIGANIHEANYAHSKPDFITKLQIALKECYETEYWLELFVKKLYLIL